MKIIDVIPEHIGKIAELERRCFFDPWSEIMLASELENEFSQFVAAVDNGTIIGYAAIRLVCGEGEITNIAVDPDRRKGGVGGALLNALISRAKNSGAEAISLEVRESNTAAQCLYAKNGFVRTGLRKGYYADNGEDAVLMTLFIEP